MKQLLARIAATLDDYKGMPVLEVGPGMGVLTKYLLDYGHDDVTAVEIDEESVDYLNHNFPSLHGRILGDDFLKMNLAKVMGDRQFCVIGNFPYNTYHRRYFSGALTTRISYPAARNVAEKEVAERLSAAPGSKVFFGVLLYSLAPRYYYIILTYKLSQDF